MDPDLPYHLLHILSFNLLEVVCVFPQPLDPTCCLRTGILAPIYLAFCALIRPQLASKSVRCTLRGDFPKGPAVKTLYSPLVPEREALAETFMSG